MKRVLLILILLLLTASAAQASTFTPTWIEHQMYDKNDVFHQIDGWTYNDPARTIINVVHTIPSGTTVIEKYYYGTNVINTRFTCTKDYVIILNCNLHVDSGIQSSDANWSDIGLLEPSVYASILTDENGTTGFGLLAKTTLIQYSTVPYPAAISLPALATSPIKSLQGQSGSKIELQVQTLTYSDLSKYVNKVNISAKQSFDASQGSFSDTINGLVYYFMIPLNYPILLIAFLEIFAFMFALSAKNMKGWWKKYIDIHVQVFAFISEHATIFLYFFAIAALIFIFNDISSRWPF